MAGNSAAPGQSVTGKVLRILTSFTGERVALTMSEITRATGLPSSTVHRLVQELVAWGGLERSAGGKYVVGVRLWEIATRSMRTYGVREIAMPFLQGLWETTKAHVLLAVLDGGEALLVERIAGTRNVPESGRAGGRLPLHASSSGKVLLAYSDPALREAVLAQPLPAFTPNTITDPRALALELKRIRRDGVATSREELTTGSYSCAAPVFGPPNADLAAVSLLTSAGYRDQHELEILVRMTARGVTNALAQHRRRTPISPLLRGRTLPPKDPGFE
ncbi:IclR family transcriptional regulator [Arthrobacter crystallopoietes]|uniref:IclR family transcriptional regulator n=1 Tax=Crystallibacter crystallopoietes TaxID=37928 RepID=UPI003D22F13E